MSDDELRKALQDGDTERVRRLFDDRSFDLTSYAYFEDALKGGCLDIATQLADRLNSFEIMSRLYRLVPFEPRTGNMTPLRFFLTLDQPISRINRYRKHHNDPQYVYEHLIQGWVWAKVHNAHGVARDMGRFFRNHHDLIRPGLSYYPRKNAPAAQKRPLRFALENHHDEQRIEKLLDTFVPNRHEIALLIDRGHVRAARLALEKDERHVDLTDPKQRIPRRSDEQPTEALSIYLDHYGCEQLVDVLDGPEHLRTLLQAQPAIGEAAMVGMIKSAADHDIEPYLSVVLQETPLSSIVRRIGTIEYESDRERLWAEAILLYARDRGVLDNERLCKAAYNQLRKLHGGARPDPDFLRLLYRLGLSTDHLSVLDTKSTLTTDAIEVTIQKETLNADQYHHVLSAAMLNDNAIEPAELLRRGHRPKTVEGYQKMARCIDTNINGETLEAFFAAWSRDPEVELVGARVVQNCLESTDFSWSYYSQFEGDAFQYALQAGWRPADDDHLRSVYELIKEHESQHEMVAARYGQMLIEHNMPPPPDLFEQFDETFVRMEWLDAMDRRQQQAYELEAQRKR